MNIEGIENVILSYFQLSGSDYVLYTKKDQVKEVYLSHVVYYSKSIHLQKVEKKNSEILKKFINYLLGQEKDTFFLKANGYQPLSVDQLMANSIYRKGEQVLHLTEEKYKIICKNSKLNLKEEKDISTPWMLFLLFILVLAIVLYIVFPI